MWPDRQVKATEQYILVVLFIILHREVLAFDSLDEILECDIQTKAIEQYFPVVELNKSFYMLYGIVLTFKSGDEILTVIIPIKASF